MIKKMAFLIGTVIIGTSLFAQQASDTTLKGKVTVIKDSRLEILAKKEAEFNKTNNGTGSNIDYGPRAAKGYRLMVLNSDDRTYAMKVRTKLLQQYGGQKVYMSYQAPFIKLMFGDFIDKADADMYKRMIKSSGIVSTNIYVVATIVEVKPEKNKENDDD
jgi:hypothetical protein